MDFGANSQWCHGVFIGAPGQLEAASAWPQGCAAATTTSADGESSSGWVIAQPTGLLGNCAQSCGGIATDPTIQQPVAVVQSGQGWTTSPSSNTQQPSAIAHSAQGWVLASTVQQPAAMAQYAQVWTPGQSMQQPDASTQSNQAWAATATEHQPAATTQVGQSWATNPSQQHRADHAELGQALGTSPVAQQPAAIVQAAQDWVAFPAMQSNKHMAESGQGWAQQPSYKPIAAYVQSNKSYACAAPSTDAPSSAVDMAGRCVLYIAGRDTQSWAEAKFFIGDDALVVDCDEKIKGKKGKFQPSRRIVDSVASDVGFPASVDATLTAARQSSKVVVQCRKGIHRSPVVGAAAKEKLIMEGYTVAICELSKCQPDIIPQVINVMEDWHAGRRASAQSPASYENFKLIELATEDKAIAALENMGIGRQSGPARAPASAERSAPYGGRSSSRQLPTLPLLRPASDAAGSASAQPASSAATLAGLPPPPPVPTEVQDLASGASSLAAAEGLTRPDIALPWDEDAIWYIENYNLDDAAQAAMRDLGQLSIAELGKALRKLTTKAARGDEVRNPSAFVAIACRNAIAKVSRSG